MTAVLDAPHASQADLPGGAPVEATSRRGRGPSLGAVAAATVALAGVVIGLQPLSDNSFLTHLATGRLIVEHWSVPHVDPYSFTSAGAHWVDQSWLPELVYGLLDKLGGGTPLVLFHGVLSAGLALVLWRLSRAGSSVGARLLAVLLVCGAGMRLWAPRPLLFGLLFLGLTAVVAEEERSPRWLVAVGWLWANSHGSFPLGIVYLVCRLAGRRLDGKPVRRLAAATGALTAGCALGAVGPVGPALLVFPLHLLSRHDVLSHVVEWRTADFGTPFNLAFLVVAAGALVAARRTRLEHVVPAAAFAVLGVMAMRNIAPASIALTPLLARVVRVPGATAGPRRRAPRGGAVLAALAGVAGLLFVHAAASPAYDLATYPVAELSWMRAHGLLDGRVAAPDFVGNYRGWSEGAHGQVFQDDRYDMYPLPLLDAGLALFRGGPGWDKALDDYRIDAVLWPKDTALASLLRADGRWQPVHVTDGWVVAARRHP